MAFIKTDPSQTKTVIALLVVLLSTVGVTAYRISPSDPQKETVKAKTEVASKAHASVSPDTSGESNRNPFAGPAAVDRSGKTSRFSNSTKLPHMPGLNEKIGPWNPGKISITSEKPIPVVINEELLPKFELMSTVKGPDGYCAVIRIDGSDTRVVNIGDRVTGGFKMVAISPDRAVLIKSKIKVIAARPINDGETTESGENAL